MNKSESIGALALALSKLQGEVQNVYKDKQGYGYKYTELSSVLEVTRPLCAKYELAVTQLCGTETLMLPPPSTAAPVINVTVETVLMHSSGEWISSTLTMPILTSKTMSAVQGAGSSISYARRYALAALLGIAQTDNDGSIHPETEAKPAIEAKPATVATPPADTQEQMTKKLKGTLGEGTQPYVDAMTPTQRLLQLVKEKGLQEKEAGWLTHFKVESLEQLSSIDAVRLIKTIEGKA